MIEPLAAIDTIDQDVSLPLGPALAEWLAGTNIAGGDEAELLDGLDTARRLFAWTAAVEATLLAALQQRQDAIADPADKAWLSEDVGAVLRVSGGYARTRMMHAADLVTKLPRTLHQLSEGDLHAGQARFLAESVTLLPAEVCAAIEELVLPRASGQSTRQFQAAVRRAIIAADPKTAEQAHKQAVRERSVRIYPQDDGMALLWALLPMPDAIRIETAINHLATANRAANRAANRPTANVAANAADNAADNVADNVRDARCGDNPKSGHCSEQTASAGTSSSTSDGAKTAETEAAETDTAKTDTAETDTAKTDTAKTDTAETETAETDTAETVKADQRRADALTELAERYLADPNAMATPANRRPDINVTISLETLLGLDDEPAELSGYGPVSAELARRIAADPSSTWRRLVVDPLGKLLDYGRTRYTPPKDLADFVRARDRTCSFPTCNRRAADCELDHVRAWTDLGETNPDNLGALCARHHHLKHEGGWTVTRDAKTGSHEWTSPVGRRYTNRPAVFPTGNNECQEFATGKG